MHPHTSNNDVLPTANYKLPAQSHRFPWSRFWIALGMLVLFLSALIVVFLWNPEPMSDDEERALLRRKNLAQLNATYGERLATYGWVDQAHGVVHIPIEKAMELEIKALNDPKWKPHPAYPIAAIDLVSVPAGISAKTN